MIVVQSTIQQCSKSSNIEVSIQFGNPKTYFDLCALTSDSSVGCFLLLSFLEGQEILNCRLAMDKVSGSTYFRTIVVLAYLCINRKLASHPLYKIETNPIYLPALLANYLYRVLRPLFLP